MIETEFQLEIETIFFPRIIHLCNTGSANETFEIIESVLLSRHCDREREARTQTGRINTILFSVNKGFYGSWKAKRIQIFSCITADAAQPIINVWSPAIFKRGCQFI